MKDDCHPSPDTARIIALLEEILAVQKAQLEGVRASQASLKHAAKVRIALIGAKVLLYVGVMLFTGYAAYYYYTTLVHMVGQT